MSIFDLKSAQLSELIWLFRRKISPPQLLPAQFETINTLDLLKPAGRNNSSTLLCLPGEGKKPELWILIIEKNKMARVFLAEKIQILDYQKILNFKLSFESCKWFNTCFDQPLVVSFPPFVSGFEAPKMKRSAVGKAYFRKAYFWPICNLMSISEISIIVKERRRPFSHVERTKNKWDGSRSVQWVGRIY